MPSDPHQKISGLYLPFWITFLIALPMHNIGLGDCKYQSPGDRRIQWLCGFLHFNGSLEITYGVYAGGFLFLYGISAISDGFGLK